MDAKEIEAAVAARVREELADMRGKHVDPIGDIKAAWDKFREMSAFRMVQWAVITVLVMWSSKLVGDAQWAAALWKLGIISGGGYIGYWVSRAVLHGRPHLEASAVIRTEMERNRAIIVAGAMLAAAFG